MWNWNLWCIARSTNNYDVCRNWCAQWHHKLRTEKRTSSNAYSINLFLSILISSVIGRGGSATMVTQINWSLPVLAVRAVRMQWIWIHECETKYCAHASHRNEFVVSKQDNRSHGHSPLRIWNVGIVLVAAAVVQDASATMSNCIKMQLHFRSTMSSDFYSAWVECIGERVTHCWQRSSSSILKTRHTWLGRIARQVHICDVPKITHLIIIIIKYEKRWRTPVLCLLLDAYDLLSKCAVARLTDEHAVAELETSSSQ